MSDAELREECLALIAFYEKHGYDWLDALAFTILRARDMLHLTHPCCVHHRKKR